MGKMFSRRAQDLVSTYMWRCLIGSPHSQFTTPLPGTPLLNPMSPRARRLSTSSLNTPLASAWNTPRSASASPWVGLDSTDLPTMPSLFSPLPYEDLYALANDVLQTSQPLQSSSSPRPPQRKNTGSQTEIIYFDALVNSYKTWRIFPHLWLWSSPAHLSRAEAADRTEVGICSLVQVVASWRPVDIALSQAVSAGMVPPSAVETISPRRGASVYVLDLLQIRQVAWAAVLSRDGRRGLIPVECLATTWVSSPKAEAEPIIRPLHESARTFAAAWVKVPGTSPARVDGLVHPGFLSLCEAVPKVKWHVVRSNLTHRFHLLRMDPHATQFLTFPLHSVCTSKHQTDQQASGTVARNGECPRIRYRIARRRQAGPRRTPVYARDPHRKLAGRHKDDPTLVHLRLSDFILVSSSSAF
jgi:hypothetical protein